MAHRAISFLWCATSSSCISRRATVLGITKTTCILWQQIRSQSDLWVLLRQAQQSNGPQFGGMQAAPLAASGMREGPVPHPMQQTQQQQLQQQQFPQSVQPLGQPGGQMYQPSGQPMRQPPLAQEQHLFQDSFGGVPPAQSEPAFQSALETQT